MGRFDDAASNYEVLIAKDPGYTRAHFALSALKKQSVTSNHIKRLEALLPKVRSSVEHLHARYALAKECEDLAKHDASFHHVEAANRPRKVELGYSIESDGKLFERLVEQFARDDYFRAVASMPTPPSSYSACPARAPRSSIGFCLPSLVESAGELQVMQIVIKRLTATASRVASILNS